LKRDLIAVRGCAKKDLEFAQISEIRTAQYFMSRLEIIPLLLSPHIEEKSSTLEPRKGIRNQFLQKIGCSQGLGDEFKPETQNQKTSTDFIMEFLNKSLFAINSSVEGHQGLKTRLRSKLTMMT
jgi:hypothetical protein